MKNRMMKEFVKTLMTGLLVITMTAALTGCKGSQSAGQAGAAAEETEESGETEENQAPTFIEVTDTGVAAHFRDKNKDSMGGTGIEIGEGQYLSIDNQLTSGRVRVRVTAGGDDIETVPTMDEDTPATIDYVFDAEGGVTDYYEIEPGSYMITFTAEEDAEGSIYANVKAAE